LHWLANPHDIIPFFVVRSKDRFAEFRELYEKGLSLREVSNRTAVSISTVRTTLVRNNVQLRAGKKANEKIRKKAQRAFWGAIPYGYCVFDGQIVMDPNEYKVVQMIPAQWQSGRSFNAIAKWLNGQRIPSKLRKKWSDKAVASVIRRHKGGCSL
jgi:hypothetical protein